VKNGRACKRKENGYLKKRRGFVVRTLQKALGLRKISFIVVVPS